MVEVAAEGKKALQFGGRTGASGLRGLKSALQLLDDARLPGFGAVRLQTETPEAEVGETLVDHLERSHLGADEEDGAALSERVRNQVRNALALARPRGAVDEQMAASAAVRER